MTSTFQQVPSTVTNKHSKNKKTFSVPQMKYDLSRINSEQILRHLDALANSGSFSTEQAIEQYNIFRTKIENAPTGSQWTIGHIPAPPNSEVTRRVIGTDGYFFKMTTNLNQIEFIWHDRISNTFLFWGTSNFKVVKALNSIRWRIQKCYETLPPPFPPPSKPTYEEHSDMDTDTDYDDLPELISYGSQPDNEHFSIE